MLLHKSNDFKGFYDLHCDKSFDFDGVQEKCIRALVGNCLYDEIRDNVNAYKVIEQAPQYIKDLVDGAVYTKDDTNTCSCDYCCNCNKRAWIGLRDLVGKCIRLNYLNTKRAEIIRLQNKSDSTIKLLKKSLVSEKIDLHNDLTFYNNIGDCNCVSLVVFIKDHDNLIKNYSGKRYSLISII